MSQTPTDSGTGTLGKAVAVLDVVANANRPLRFTELLAQIDQPRGTLHRQISNLVDEGLLKVNPDHSYELGLRLLRFASRAWAGNRFREIAEPHLRGLHDKAGETVHLGVLQGIEVIYLDKVESRQAVRMHSQIGNASPCYCTGVGKAAFSMLPDDEARRRAETITYHQHTATTIRDADGLMREIADIRANGFAIDREEHEPGIHCVAAPIRVPDKSLLAGLSVTAPVYRVSAEQILAWADDVRATADAISEDLNIRLGPRG